MSKHRTRGTMLNRMLAGVLSLALALSLLPASGLVQLAQAANWADPYGQQLVEWGVMNPSSNLRLDDTITRAEFVTMCNRAFGYSKLGGMPFIDVPSSAWYAQDIDIAYNAGYFKGTTSDPAYPTASPNASLTREQAAVMVARNLMLQETVGESLGFTDSRSLNEWSRGLIGAAVAEGMITGYSDGSYRPFNNITRGEVAAMLVRIIGTPINKAGSYELGSVYGNVTISSSDATLRNTIIVGNLYVTGGVDLGNVLLENVTVLGQIVISGGGESDASRSSVVLRNVEADELVVDSMIDQFVTISAYGITDIPVTTVRSNAYLEDESSPGYGLHHIELAGTSGTKLQLAGNIKEVVNKTPFSDLQLVKGSAERVTIDEYAKGSQVLVDTGTRMDELNLDVATLVTGEGDIRNLNISADECEVDILPDNVVIRPGITATVDGEVMGSVAASELSSEPRILAGYPNVVNIAPTQAEGLFSGNKPGTIYWAVSDLSSGSVSVEDLISNPAYGGNIFAKQAGSIDAGSRTEYGRQITSLVPDGSYYISAVLVDGRGRRSPLKVAAFTTPDNTVPAFVSGYPYMSKTTCTVAQVTAMANKNCQLYYALLPAGANAPTPQEFKTGSVGGNYGYGSLSVVKNAPISITVNRNRLQEKTTYDLFLWLTDHNGAQSMAAPVRLTFTTPDETPPIVTTPIQTAYAANTAGVTFSINEAPSTLYWAVVAEGNETFIAPGDTDEETSEIMSDLRTKIKVESGAGALVNGNTAAAGANVETLFTIRNLDTATTKTNNYIMYYVAKDAAGNYSDKVSYIRIRTLDTTPPTVTQEFVDAVDGKPRAGNDIRLVFSEQVKGSARQSTDASGNTPETFLDFYNVVASTSGELQKEAKNRLAAELAAHIKLYSVPRNGQPVPLEPRADTYTGTDWVIDWHEAIIEMDPNGNVVITLPAGKALQLESGATYYFQLLGVFDNAYIPNGVMGDPNGNYKLPNFTTIYAQVELRQNTNVIRIHDDDYTGDGDIAIPPYEDIRLDMCFDVIPESTSKVPLTEYWDLIMWSDTSIGIEIYRQDITLKTDENPESKAPWEKVINDVVDIDPPGTAGISVGNKKTGSQDQKFQTVQQGLLEGHTYRYGIHITRIGNISEKDKKADPDSWGDKVTMRFSLIAGSLGDINIVSANVDGNYNEYVNVTKSVSEIGIVYTTTGTENILVYTKQFVDTKVPSFQKAYPDFHAGSGAITMELGLDRSGKVYYVVAPVGSITTGIDADNLITSANDSLLTENTYTYIPTNGPDREITTKLPHIYFRTMVNGKYGEYWSPTYRDIIDGRTVFSRNPDIKVGGPVEVGVAIETVTVSNLKPNTPYYVYFVLQGGGDPGHVVEIYRVKTDEVRAPSISITPYGTTGVTMAVNNVTDGSTSPDLYDSPLLYYALVEWNSLPTMFLDRYQWKENGSRYTGTSTGGAAASPDPSASPAPTPTPAPVPADVMTVLDAMITPYPGGTGQTYFDKFGAEPGIDLKDRVMQYISSTTGDVVGRVPTHRYPSTQTNPKTEDCTDYMTSNTSEYVVLACARHINGTNTGDSYGFAASRGLYKPDLVPPEFIGDMPLYEATITAVTNNSGDTITNQSWRYDDDAPTYSYRGKIELKFSKAVYYVQQDANGNRVRKQIWNVPASELTDTSTQISILDVLGGTGKSKFSIAEGDKRTGAVDTFTLTFRGLVTGDSITMANLGNNNNQSNPNGKTLTMRFDAGLTSLDFYGKDTTYVEMHMPGFRVTWRTA